MRPSLGGCAVACLLTLAAAASHARAAPRTWSVVVCGPTSDPRRPAVTEAIDFWNDRLTTLHANLALGPATICERTIPDDLLSSLSEGMLNQGRSGRLPREFDDLRGDVLIVLSGADLISVGLRESGGHHGLIVLRRGDVPPLSLPNVARNVIAHEIGHVLGLVHNSDPATLMCGRPSPCRPAVFQSETKRFFPLTDADQRELTGRFK